MLTPRRSSTSTSPAILAGDLDYEGAGVVLTPTNNSGVGPCVTTRSAMLDASGADVAVAIHADGGPPGRGFAILEAVADGPNQSDHRSFRCLCPRCPCRLPRLHWLPISTYDGVDGLQPRDNLAGLNLTTIPEVYVECGNMSNATDAVPFVTTAFQQRAARGLALAITDYLSAR